MCEDKSLKCKKINKKKSNFNRPPVPAPPGRPSFHLKKKKSLDPPLLPRWAHRKWRDTSVTGTCVKNSYRRGGWGGSQSGSGNGNGGSGNGGSSSGGVQNAASSPSSLLPLTHPATPVHSIAPSLSLARSPSLSPFLNWHWSGSKHDNKKTFLRSALSGSPPPGPLETHISRRTKKTEDPIRVYQAAAAAVATHRD